MDLLRPLRRFIAMAAVVGASQHLLANDANWSSVGGAMSLVPHATVQMRREDVRVVMHDDRIHVRATFDFRNVGRATKVRMAFPDETTTNHGKSVITRIATKVDGLPVGLVRQPVRTDDEFQFKSVWVKEVEFSAGQERRVVVDYSATPGFAGSGWSINSYIFSTGSSWAGVIEDCRFSVDWSGLQEFSRPTLDPIPRGEIYRRIYSEEPPARWEKPKIPWQFHGPRRASFHLRNLKPAFDIDLTSVLGFWNFTMNGQRMPQNLSLFDEARLEGNGRDPQIPASGLS